MSEPQPQHSEPPVSDQPVGDQPRLPTEAELARVATPVTVRRAPRYRPFMTAGALVGVVVAVVLVQVLATGDYFEADGTGFVSVLDGRGSVRLLMALGLGVLGAFVGGALAVLADRRSLRGR
ncbi:histidine kinase [Cellulomonas sp. P22]|uniref:histidine kinase n=1 Tax=Cellulomonas sp. P22 TaxID=3373189 RepID=UPI0037A5AED5